MTCFVVPFLGLFFLRCHTITHLGVSSFGAGTPWREAKRKPTIVVSPERETHPFSGGTMLKPEKHHGSPVRRQRNHQEGVKLPAGVEQERVALGMI